MWYVPSEAVPSEAAPIDAAEAQPKMGVSCSGKGSVQCVESVMQFVHEIALQCTQVFKDV